MTAINAVAAARFFCCRRTTTTTTAFTVATITTSNFLARFKAAGVGKLPDRQRLANALSRDVRERWPIRALPARINAPTASVTPTTVLSRLAGISGCHGAIATRVSLAY